MSPEGTWDKPGPAPTSSGPRDGMLGRKARGQSSEPRGVRAGSAGNMAVISEGEPGPEKGSVPAGTRVRLSAESVGHRRVGVERFGHEPCLTIIQIFIYFLREG